MDVLSACKACTMCGYWPGRASTRPSNSSSLASSATPVSLGKMRSMYSEYSFGIINMSIIVRGISSSSHSLCSQSRLRCLRFFWRRPFGGGGNGWPGLWRGNRCLGGGFGMGTFSELLNWNSTSLNNLSILRDSRDSFDSLRSGKTISDSRGKTMILELGSGRGTGGLWARVNEHKANDKSDKDLGILYVSYICIFKVNFYCVPCVRAECWNETKTSSRLESETSSSETPRLINSKNSPKMIMVFIYKYLFCVFFFHAIIRHSNVNAEGGGINDIGGAWCMNLGGTA